MDSLNIFNYIQKYLHSILIESKFNLLKYLKIWKWIKDQWQIQFQEEQNQRWISYQKQRLRSRKQHQGTLLAKNRVAIKEESGNDDLHSIERDMVQLKIDHLDLDEDNERDSLIITLQEVNEKLKYKLKDLESLAEKTVSKAYDVVKGTIESHRHWDTQDETLIQKDKELKDCQAQIEGYKKTVNSLKQKLKTLTNLDKMASINNELIDVQKTKLQLEEKIVILQKNANHQDKALDKLTGDIDYNGKLSSLNNDVNSLKEEYKQLDRELKAKESENMEHHKLLVAAETENIRLKRLLISLKNNKNPNNSLNSQDSSVQLVKRDIEKYENTIKSEDKRHLAKIK